MHSPSSVLCCSFHPWWLCDPGSHFYQASVQMSLSHWIFSQPLVWDEPPTSISSFSLFGMIRRLLLCARIRTVCRVTSDSLQPRGLQHTRPPCPSPTCPIFLHLQFFPIIRVFSNESVLHIRWPKYWSFSFNISPSNEYSGLISFRMDWLDLLAIQETLKSLLQHHSSKASILRRSAFTVVQLSHPYKTTGKTALTRGTFVGTP